MMIKIRHFFDFQTSATSMSIIGIKSGGISAYKRLIGMYGAFKYMKQGPVRVTVRPASTLPVDPMGLSYADDDPLTVDPRDQLNRGAVRATYGEDFDVNIPADTTVQQGQYNNVLLDPKWRKFSLQGGFSKTFYPKFWKIGMMEQFPWPGAVKNLPYANGGNIINSAAYDYVESVEGTATEKTSVQPNVSDGRSIFQTGGKIRPGWYPTDGIEQFDSVQQAHPNSPMSMPLGYILLPKAFKTLYYFRAYVTETYYFKGLRVTGVPAGEDDGTSSMTYYNGPGDFLRPQIANTNPDTGYTYANPIIKNDGSNEEEP